MFSGAHVSLVSRPAIPRVALCQTRTDRPSAQNKLTYDLLAVILIPLPLCPTIHLASGISVPAETLCCCPVT